MNRSPNKPSPARTPRSPDRAAATIRERSQIRALASAPRQEIVDALDAAGPCSIAELAELLGRPASALYFHIARLTRVGLLREQAPRKEGRHVATMLSLAVPRAKIDYGAASRHDLARVVRVAVRLSMREFERACLAEQDAGTDGERVLWGGRSMGWLDARGVRRANELIAELMDLFRGGRPSPSRRAFSFGFMLSPCGRVADPDRVETSTPRSVRARPHDPPPGPAPDPKVDKPPTTRARSRPAASRRPTSRMTPTRTPTPEPFRISAPKPASRAGRTRDFEANSRDAGSDRSTNKERAE